MKSNRLFFLFVALDNGDIALLGLATDTLIDLWHRLNKKSKAKTINFPL